MKVSVQNIPLTKVKCDLLLVAVFEKEKALKGELLALDRSLSGNISRLLKNGEIEGKLGETALLHTFDTIPAERVAVVGLGKKEEFDLDKARTASAAGIRLAKRIKAKKVASVVLGTGEAGAQATVEGAVLGGYEFDGHKSEKKEHRIKELVIVENDRAGIKKVNEGARIGEITADAENRARDLVNGPSNQITPTYLANYARKMAKENGLKCAVFDPKTKGMASIHAVAKGSREPAKVVVLSTRVPRPSSQKIALIGKGITFDSGGISLKPPKNLWEMKTDMAGAAAVIETMRAFARLKIKKNVFAVIPLTENMPGGGALKPGDVVSSLSGITAEIISTDAEGRMILADAITYAKKLGAKTIVDCATLTGGCIIALGDAASGLLGNSEALIHEMEEAAEKSGEKVWHLPLFKEYEEYLKSDVADHKNCTEGKGASPSTGATYLHKYVGDTPWVHLDIAGTANLSSKKGYLSKGATGVPVRTLVEFLRA